VIGYCGQFVREWPKQTKCWATFYHGKTCASILTKKLLAFWVVFFHKLIRSPCTCFTHFRCRASNKLFFFFAENFAEQIIFQCLYVHCLLLHQSSLL
jgi:hypothetical protein